MFGVAGHYIYINVPDADGHAARHIVTEIGRNLEQEISEDNYSCGLYEQQTVGSVLSDMLSSSIAHKLNPLSAGCFETTCSLSVSYCRPWQTQECNQTFLIYQRDQNDDAILGSFKCIDLP
ncbi:hypothetical protein DBZ36_12045 [Alginatibacterium sediminis]|uniref:Uncharacterized protein n=1 Tax=Alginatibacterium sediminis TaxID=2164068 RepID=A0A420EBF7_9ALTE|nr:hypothetical protein DBZ36_12045 [Alginatibacterium sediminis]